MREGFDRLKATNYFQLHRNFLDFALNTLNEAEFKLWIALRGSSYDFEGENIGQVLTTIALIKKRFNWSQGKSSTTLKNLIQKKFARRIKVGLYYIPRTISEVQDNEHFGVQINEAEVHSDEVNVQPDEQNKFASQSYKVKESSISSQSEIFSPNEIERIWNEICKEDSKKGKRKGVKC